jgi:hypothetical protein
MYYHAYVIRDNQVGQRCVSHNFVHALGARHFLGTFFDNDNFGGANRLGLIKEDGFVSFSNSDTCQYHPGWLEATGLTSIPNRPLLSTVTTALGNHCTIVSIVGPSCVITGFFATADNTIGSENGNGSVGNGFIWSMTRLPRPISLIHGDILIVTYLATIVPDALV